MLEIVGKTVKLTDNVMPQTLGVVDQLRLILKQFSNSDEAELDGMEKLSVRELQMKAGLAILIEKAVARMLELGKKSVWLGIPNEYEQYIDFVTSSNNGKGRYYNFTIIKRKHNQVLPYTIIMRVGIK